MATSDEGRSGGNFPQDSGSREPFLRVLRELAEAYHAFAAYSAAHVRQLGLTPAQFDVIATLGNTAGLPFNELARRTLVTKGTLTGIIDRLEAKGLVRREVPIEDRRSFRACLTASGETLFAAIFPAHLAHLRRAFGTADEAELTQMADTLRALRARFQEP